MSERLDASQELPPGWCWTTLGSCSEFLQYGSSAKTTSDPTGVPVLRMGNLRHDGSLDLTQLKYLPGGHNEFPALLLEPGDILFNRTNSAELVGKTGVYRGVPSPCSFASYLIRVRLHDGVLPTLISAFLNSGHGRRWIKSVVNQTVGQANVNGTKLAAFDFPLPPLGEQQRIVDTLDELLSDLDAGVEALETARRKLAHYQATVLKAAVEGALTAEWRRQHPATEPASALLTRILVDRRRRWEEEQVRKFAAAGKEPPNNWRAKYKDPVAPDTTKLPLLPDRWCWASLDQLCFQIRNGFSMKPDAMSGVPILRISSVRALTLDSEDVRYLSGEEVDYAEFLVQEGDLLFTRYNGTKSLVAVCAVVRGIEGALVHPDKLIRARTPIGLVDQSFVAVAANVGASRRFLETRIRTTAGQAGVSGNDIKSTPIPLAPLFEQELIVAEVEDQLSVIEHIEADLEAKLKTAQALRQSILRHAFTGRLVPQDPNDEPASELLKRIAAEREERARLTLAGRHKGPKREVRHRRSRKALESRPRL